MQEHLQESQSQKVMKLMEMFNISIQDAQTLLRRTRFNLDAAINLKIGHEEEPISSLLGPYDFRSIKAPLIDVDLDDEPILHRTNRRQQFHDIPNKSRVQQFKKTYIIKKKEKAKPKKTRTRRTKDNNSVSHSNSKEEKMEEEIEFLPELIKIVQKKVHVAFRSELAQIFEEMLEKKKVVALHSLKLHPSSRQEADKIQSSIEHIKVLYLSKEFVENCNKYFINFGLDPSNFDFDHYPFMKDLISKSDEFTIVLLRLNELSLKVEVLRKWKIVQTFKLPEVQKFNKIIQDVSKVHNRMSYQASQGIMPMTQEQIQKIENDRLIRQQQEKEYFQTLNFQEQIQAQQIIKKKEQNKIEQVQDIAKQKRQKKRSQLVIYEPQSIKEGIYFKIRLPNSSIFKLKVPKNETVQYLFDIIECHEDEDIGFDQEPNRNFDILQPLERMSLQDRKKETIGAVFYNSDMETLVVKEL